METITITAKTSCFLNAIFSNFLWSALLNFKWQFPLHLHLNQTCVIQNIISLITRIILHKSLCRIQVQHYYQFLKNNITQDSLSPSPDLDDLVILFTKASISTAHSIQYQVISLINTFPVRFLTHFNIFTSPFSLSFHSLCPSFLFLLDTAMSTG